MEKQNKIWDKIINSLTPEQIIKVVMDLGSAYPKSDGNNNLVFQSVCHHSNSWKLCYYTETHSFFCYKDWDSFNIFSLVMESKECDFNTAFKYVCDITGYQCEQIHQINGFSNSFVKSDWDLFDRYNQIQDTLIKKDDKVNIINPNILKLYQDIYYQGWVDEHISIEAMKKYQIKFDSVNNRIIIPHFNNKGDLIGIRCRNLSKNTDIKYCPIIIENTLYSHPLSSVLYGWDKNKNIICNLKKVMIVEAEKSVLQAESYFPNNNFVVACCGSNISLDQIQLLVQNGVTEVILALDWDFNEVSENDVDYQLYKHKILKIAQKLLPYFTVEVLFPTDDMFKYKDSPTDNGKEYLLESMKQKQTITYEMICESKEGEKNH